MAYMACLYVRPKIVTLLHSRSLLGSKCNYEGALSGPVLEFVMSVIWAAGIPQYFARPEEHFFVYIYIT